MQGKLTSGLLYIFLIIILLTLAGMTLTGGIIPINAVIPPDAVPSGEQIIVSQAESNPKDNLQLKTFTIQNCQKTLAVDFLIDTSGSMAFNNKLPELKQALNSFLGNLTDNSVVGMQSFSMGARNVADVDYYKNNKSKITSFISSLHPVGGTYTRDGFTLAQQKLSDAVTQNKFPGYNYALIFISDGAPTYQNTRSSDCLVYSTSTNPPTCFSKKEDPRTPPDVSQEIKDMEVKIFSVGIFGAEDASLRPYEEQLFQSVSSQPLGTYYYETLSPTDLPKIFDTISSKVCE